jgi:hypothetical protein
LRHRQLELSPRGARRAAGGETGQALERAAAAWSGWVLRRPSRLAVAGALLRWIGRRLPGLARLGPFARWTATRELPPLPERSFQQAYAQRSARGEAARRST